MPRQYTFVVEPKRRFTVSAHTKDEARTLALARVRDDYGDPDNWVVTLVRIAETGRVPPLGRKK